LWILTRRAAAFGVRGRESDVEENSENQEAQGRQMQFNDLVFWASIARFP